MLVKAEARVRIRVSLRHESEYYVRNSNPVMAYSCSTGTFSIKESIPSDRDEYWLIPGITLN